MPMAITTKLTMRGPRTREVLLWPTALTVNNSRAVPTTWQSETQWTTRREEKKNSSDTETLNRWDVHFYLIVVVPNYLVNGTTEVWNTNIWSRHKDTGSLIVVSYTRPISPGKVKEGIPALHKRYKYDMVVEAKALASYDLSQCLAAYHFMQQCTLRYLKTLFLRNFQLTEGLKTN